MTTDNSNTPPTIVTPAVQEQTPEQMRADMEAVGLTPEHIEHHLARERMRRGETPPAATPAPDMRSPEAVYLDNQFPPAKPHEYDTGAIGWQMTPEQVAEDKAIRQHLAAGLWPKENGGALVKEINRVNAEIELMHPAELQMWQQSQKLELERMWGERTDENIRLVKQLAAEWQRSSPGVLEAIGPAGDAAFVVAQIFAHAQRRAARLTGDNAETLKKILQGT